MNTFPRMHVSLYVTDIHKTIAFYNDLFQTQPVKVKPGYAKYVLEEPSLIISFVEHADRVNPHFGHLGFQVEHLDQLLERKAQLENASHSVLEEMGVACCYAVQDKFWISDPDGYRWEMYVFKEDAEWNDPRFAESNAEACCINLKPELAASALQPEPAAEESTCCAGAGCC